MLPPWDVLYGSQPGLNGYDEACTAYPIISNSSLDLVFVGFNPGKRSPIVGHYYAGRGNTFWPLLYESGLLPEVLTFTEDYRLPEFGIGLADLVKRPSRSSGDLSRAETRAGAVTLTEKLLTYAPRVVCFNGKGVYAWYGNRPTVALGRRTIPSARHACSWCLPPVAAMVALVEQKKPATFEPCSNL